jgi:hypothetical protein
MNTHILRRIILSAAAIIALLVVGSSVDFSKLGSDDSGRSTSAYCDAWLNYTESRSEEYNRILESGTEAEKLQMIAAMPGDIAELYDTVHKVAPSEIEPDIARAAQDAHVFEEQNRHVPTDVLGLGAGFLEKLFQSANASTTQKRIHDWNAANCENLQGENAYFN